MIKSVTVINPSNEMLTIELMRPETSGLLLANIEGLGPPKATINMTELNSGDGSRFNSSRAGTRNLVMDMVLLPSPDIESARLRTYQFFPIKKQVILVFETDKRFVSATGYVESNTPNIFSSRESTQISIVCPDAYFYALEENETLFSRVEPLFEFPFENTSTTVASIEFGNIIVQQAVSVVYTGDVDTGLTFHIHANGPVTDIKIENTRTGEEMTISSAKIQAITGSGIIEGDDIVLTTVRGSKSIYLVRNGVRTNIMNSLERYSAWFTLVSGDNVFAYSATDGVANLQFRIVNQTVYEGV